MVLTKISKVTLNIKKNAFRIVVALSLSIITYHSIFSREGIVNTIKIQKNLRETQAKLRVIKSQAEEEEYLLNLLEEESDPDFIEEIIMQNLMYKYPKEYRIFIS
jgi:cell division protein FtsB